MATSASGISPLSQALQSLGVERPAPAAQMDPKSAFEGLARQTNVPANVLMALDEAEGGGADIDRARRNADFLGKRLAGGAKLDDVVAEMAGDAERGAALMSRSYDIADALYPEQAAPKAAPGIGTDLKDLGKLGVAGAVNMTGGALQALGAVADDAIRAGARAELEASGGDPAQVQGESIVRSGSRAAADAVRGAGDAVAGSISDRMKQAMEGTRFEGELFSPSTWSAGDDPSIRGVLGHTAQGLGSMIPVAAASAVAGPTGAAVMGGLGAAGEGAQSGRDFVQAARGREGEAGPAAIEAMPAFRALLDQGLSPDEAAAELAGLTESEAAAWQAIPGTLGGAATGKILSRAEGMLNAGGRTARAAKKGLAGAIEEGVQEAAEGMASQQGIAVATGADVNTQQDSFGNFVLGALSGGVMGAGAGLVGPGQTDSEQSGDATGDATLGDGDSGGPDVPLLPAPENGGTIFGQSQTRQEPGSFDRDPSNPRRAAADQSGAGAQFRPADPPPAGNSRPDAAAEAERIFRAQPDTMDLPADAPIPPEIDGEFTEIPPISDTGPDGSGAGAVAAPGVAAPLSGAPGAAATTPIPEPPAGPVERLALGIAAATPPAPAARFPDQRPGSAVRFGDMASGQIIDGVFLGETEAGARVRVQGREIDLTPEQFDALRDAAPQIEDARKQAEKAAKDAAKAKPAQEAPADVEPVSAAQWTEQGAGNTDVRLGNDGPDLGEGTAPGGVPVPQGLQGVQELAGGRGTAAGTGNDNQQDGVGGVVLADDAGKLGTALTNAHASGVVEHVTKNGKTKTGYVLQGVTKAEADKIDAYSFRKNGGFFVNTDRADEWAATAVGDQVNASTIDAGLDPAQSPSDQRSTNTEPLGNGPLAHALSQKGKDVGSRDRQHMKLTHVVSAINDPQILKSVVESVPVDVMNVLMGQKVSPEALLKNPAMLAHRLSVPSDKPIPEPVRAFLDALHASVGGLTAGGRAEETGLNSGSGAVKLPRDGGSAGAAGGADLWHGEVLGQHVTINHNPSEKQKEAGNYNKGAVRWNGLDLSIENAKGSERRGKGPDGAEWSVTMPADYGYFRGTEGADGDHVDFYMGDVPDSDYVLIVDQVDADTGKFDEHKVITGTTARGAALGLYRDGFSDGRGDARIGAMTETTVEGMKAWLKGGQMRRPAAGRLDYPFKGRAKAQANKAAADTKRNAPKEQQAKPKASVSATTGLTEAEEARLAALKAKLAGKLRNQVNSGLDPEILGIAVEMTGLYVKGGMRKFGAILRNFMADTGLTASQSQRYLRAAYGDVRDEMDLAGEDVSGMDDAAAVMAEVRAALAERLPPRDAAPVTEPGAEGKPQAIIPGAEGSADQAKAGQDQRTRAEMEARQQQSKIRKAGGNSGDAGPLFDRQNDMFDAPAPQKRPLIQYVAKAIGGIDPTGAIAAELNHRGITTRTAPGLFRKGGHMDLDNVPASEHPDLAALVGTDDTGNYLDAGAIVEGIAEEVAGRPQPLGEQAELQERAQAVDKALAHIRDQEADHIIVPRGDDPRGATERKDAIARALGDFLDKYAQDSLTGAERKTIIETLNLDGGEIENAVEDAIMRRPLDEPGTAEGEDADIPFGDVGGDPQPGTAGSAPDGSEAEAFDFGRMPSQEPGTTGQGEVNGPASGSENAALAGSRGAKGGRRGNGRASVSVTGPQGLDSALAEGVAGGGDPTGSIESADAGGAGPVGSVVSGNDGRPEGGNEPGRSAGAGSTRLARPKRDKPVAPTGRPDYVLTDPERIVGGGPKARFARNRAALEAMQSIESEGRDPTPEELDSIAGYIGWGSFGQELFQGSWERPVYRDGWKAENDWLREHLGEAKWKSAQGSIINAHYTDPPTVMAMWDMVRAMGFNGGRVLEPSMGIGNFFSMMPADLAARSDRTGIELDKQTGAMAKLLFPHANISIKGYQDSATPDDFYDLVIGNWPFASQSPADRRYDRLGPSLHDYFFLKALDQTRPGGLVVGITSSGTMDKNGRATRIELAKKADLVAAYRLPSGAFEGYAGTSVVTDIIILKKRAEPNANAADEAWIGTADYAAPAGTIHVNRYFLENPDNVLGRLDFGSGSTYGRAAMIVHRPADLFERLNAIRTALPSDAFTPISRGNEPRFIQNMTTDRQGSITTGPDGKGLYVVQGERLVNLSDVTSYEVKDAKETESREKQIRSLVDMRRAYGALLDAERLGEDAEAPRKRLNALFDAFRKAFGTIADSFGIKVLGKVNDPFAPALRSLERPDGTPATILTRSTMRGAVALENPTVADAYALNRNQTTTLDMEAVAEAAGVSVEDATDELVEAGAVLRIPGGGVEPKDTYLSGNVRRKLREVEGAISRGETDLADTAEKLRAVQPAPVPYYEIEARLGAPWVTADHYRQFIADMIGLKSIDAQQVDIRPVGGAWKVTFKDRSLNRRPEARSGYGVSGYPFSMLFGAAMGNRPITLKTKDEDGKDVVDEKRSAEANAAATKIRERFQEWVWEDAERTLALETAYNDAMRAIADPQYDGDFLTFPGMALTRGESPFNLRKHQRDAIWRGIYNERGLYAHEVGTGKTYTMAGIAVESRRYGKAKKPLILAHNANSAAVYAEAQEMYPGGRFLFVDNLDKGNIATTMQRIASDDWDAVIMPHSVMPRVGFREETLMALAAEEIAALEQEALDAADEDGVSLDLADMDDADAMKKVRSVTAKNLVKQRNAILERIRKSANRASKEGAIQFEELGIDMILVDEAHEFKKPPIATRMQIKGLNTQASDRSIALKLMSDYVKSRRGGTGIHLFTGTPITNALNEIFNMMNYVMDAEMEREGVKSWDMWFNTFADSSTGVEVQSTGEFEAITRLAQFVNVSELRRMAGQVLDIVFASDMPEFKPRETKSGKTLNDPTLTDAERDELLNGRTENAIGRPYKLVRTDVGQMSPAQRSVMDQVVQWSRNWKRAEKKQRREYMLKGAEESPIIHEGIAAKASLDVRSYDARLPDHPDNKVSRATRNIMHHYRESKDGAQVVFVETGYNEKAKPGHGAPFSLVKDLIGKLVAAGIPETQIAVVAGGVKAEKKKAIADAVNAGKIRVVIGQTGTLGVGVNMQQRLRAMHHLDAPWMPGDLEQRNGRGERQGNTWNTVIEYRYLTEGIDGRRWQVLAIKDRFIKAFLRADDSVRVIEGDAVDTSEGDEGGIAATLSEATGDPRLLQRAKLQKDVERLEVRERQHTIGIAQAMKAARKEREEASSREALMADYRRNAELATAARDSGKFTAEIGGTTFTERKDAAEAFKEAVDKLAQGSRDAIVAKVQGFEVRATKRFIDGIAPELWVKGSGKVNYEMGKPTLASAEAAIRNMIGLADHVARTVKEAREAAERLEAQAKRPFAQAERLAARRKLLADIEADMEANPAAPPAWLRHGAPIGTDVFVEGKPREVQGHRWTDEGYFVVTEEGLVPYLEAKAENGTSIYDEHEFESPVKDSAAKAVEKESRFRDERPVAAGDKMGGARGIDPETLTPADARAVNEAARAELEKVGLAGRVSVEATAEGRAGVTGSYLGGVIRIIRPGGNWKHTLDHEIIHALRDPSLWGARYGMFTADEWHALVKAARADKGIRDRVTAAYGDLDTPAQSEEMVAELYADWAKARRETPPGPLRSAFEKVRSFFRAVASALRGEGFVDAASIMEGIANGETLSKPPSGPEGPGGGRRQMVPAEQRESAKEQRDMGALKDALSSGVGRARGMIGDLHWKNAPGFFSSLLTDAMGKNDKFNVLSLVPGRALFDELGRGLPAAQKYLREKEAMDAWRNDWQARAAKVVDGWTATARKDPQANDGLMDLMHSSTLAGVDPSREGSWKRAVDDEARRALAGGRLSPERQEWADGVIQAANDRERMWHRLKAQYDALPSDFRDLFQKVRDEYAAMSDEQDAALMQNIRTASRIALKRADRELRKEMQRIKDEGLTGITRDEAIDKATQRNADAHARAARGGGARIQQLRQVFESNRVAGPYFPLARFGNYFVTIRDDKGAVISFSRFQTEREQRKWMEQAKERALGEIEHGVLGGDANLKGKVDPKFVAEVESLLADAGASGEMMDAVWQRWLETLPDQSVRTSRIHRKGRDGFNQDAIRAFSSAMFHGAHQTARLRHGLEMEDMLDDAEEQAKKQPDPNRAGFVVREMRQRHAFTMQPTNNAIVSWASGLAFTWYLAASPAAALVNLSQTTIVGVPLMAARFKGAGVTGVSRELGRALADFGKGKGWAQESGRLSQDERAAMKAGYDRGVIDKTQSHDLAAVAESGIEYNPTREKVMRVLSWGFHHTERLNREVTYLAAYRLARSEGAGHMQAVDEASKQVWRVHFSYQNTDRPRVMQSDMGKILTTFRNFTVNMLYRLFRDAHQSFAGSDAETRREARAQLIGISLSMFAHAGIKGVWGYGLLSMLLGALLPGDDDDFDNWLQDALLIEGDSAGTAAWNWTMGMVLNGVPGTVLDTDLTGRIGMPDLWFRGSQKDLEGKDLWSYYVEQVAGPVAGIGGSVATGLSMIADGEWQRGAEKVVPKFAANLVKSARYVEDGVTTYNGDSIIDSVNPYEALTTAMGFTPARVAERYRANTWLKNQEAKITSQRKSLMSDIGKSIKAGNGVTPELAQQVKAWNIKYPFYPITASGLRQSMASRQRLSNRSEGGVTLNPRLDQYLRTEVAPAYR